MKNTSKYHVGYYPAPACEMRWAKKDHIEKAPVWCSVDLRDGNQSLMVPMSLEEKLDFFAFLCRIGFKEIEVGFPAASETEYEFLRALIDEDRIPSDVTIQVLTQSREHIIRKTFDALAGCKTPVVVHFYNSTSVAQREQVFKKSKDEIKKIATDGAALIKQLAAEYEGDFRFEYSPESFTGTEPEYALEVCNAVLDILQPTAEKPVIINLPVTVAMSMSHVYANQVEYMSDNLKYREHVVLSLHPHNDRGCAVADTELGLLAGADRVEGTLFGNGERTGNVDIITVAMNLYSHGVDPGLDFSDMPSVVAEYEKVTRMHVYERTPYAGALVFAAFSGSHQDAIAKGMNWRQEKGLHEWTVPYLPIDPADVGRQYQTDVIRINSQSGKGGIGYLLEKNYGYDLPPKMREDFGYRVKSVSDHAHKELSVEEVHDIFQSAYMNKTAPIHITEAHYVQQGGIHAVVTVQAGGMTQEFTAKGNGRLDAVSNAIRKGTGMDFTVITYTEHALETGSTSQAVAYVGLQWASGAVTWGAGTDSDIMTASVKALASAINNKR
ncbi:2-isopropylmalate synthase [Anaerofilum sp. An201]|nr:2-isopropylmalate synthase [Anaerofilum sp. An201]OUP05466.1 2-isopropylmalate synthase [Anaerofilum sp. An201]